MGTFPRVRPGLLRHTVNDQVVVYDTQRDRVHLLDSTTGWVLESLENAQSVDAIKAGLPVFDGTLSEELLALSLDQLREAELLDEFADEVAPLSEVSRREMIRKIGFVSAAVLIPAIVTLTPNVAWAVSCSQKDGDCAVGVCCAGFGCNSRTQKCELPPGSGCSNDGDCASDRCIQNPSPPPNKICT
jgi:hypothetical protein